MSGQNRVLRMEGFGRGDAGRLRGGSRMGWRDDGGAESVGERGGGGWYGGAGSGKAIQSCHENQFRG